MSMQDPKPKAPATHSSLMLDADEAKMLRDLLTQASATGPNAATLAELYAGTQDVCERLGVK